MSRGVGHLGRTLELVLCTTAVTLGAKLIGRKNVVIGFSPVLPNSPVSPELPDSIVSPHVSPDLSH